MKIITLAQKRARGSVLVVTLLTATIIGITLASYLIMTQAQNTAVMRSQSWNTTLTLTEAGVEDGMAMINKYAGDYDQITNWSTPGSIAADSWSAAGPNTYKMTRNLGDGYYEVYITNNNVFAPIIAATAAVPWTFAYNNTPQTMLAAVGVSPTTASLKRTVVVQTKYDPLFAVAMAADTAIDLKGNGIYTDSFNSADTNHSINGLYPFSDPSMVNSNGDICSNATITNSINLGNATINGVARTGPNGTVSVGPGGYVSGGTYDDFNVAFTDVTLPDDFLSPFPVPGNDITVDGTTYNYSIMTSGDYYMNNFSSTLYIGSNVTARIYITGNVNMSGSDTIHIASGAVLRIYMAGTTFKTTGTGIVNENGYATSFSYYGLPSNTTLILGGNGSFTGSIYAPEADFTLGGGGNNTYDFIGASVTKSVTMNGHFNFHYDEALRNFGPARGYVASNWKEN